MAKKKYVVKTGYLAMGEKNVYEGSEIELESSNPGTQTLLDMGAIEEIKVPKKEILSGRTTSGKSFVDAKIEYSTSGSSFTDISGFASMVEVSGGERMSGEVYTADGDIGIVTFGKRVPVEVTYTAVFTETSTEPFERFRGYHQTADGSQVVFRWSPAGGTGTGKISFTGTGKITNAPWLGGDAASPDPLVFSVTVRTANLLKGVTA